MFDHLVSRRAALAGLATVSVLGKTLSAMAQEPPAMTVAKDPSCGCCGGWIAHVKAAGFPVRVVDTPDMDRVKAKLGVPDALASCHTAEVGGYVIEGHVPAEAVRRLLAQKPKARGLAAPGMPVGSPGMDAPGAKAEPYEIVLFGPDGQRTFARYLGTREI